MSPFFKPSTTAANLLSWLPAAPMSPFAAAAAAASVRAAASAPPSPPPALSTAAPPPVATMTPVAAPSSAPPAHTAEETPTPPADTSPPHTAEAPFLPSETPYPPTIALAPALGGDASVTAFMTAAAAPAPIHAPQPHKPLPPCPQNHSNTHGQCAPPCAVSPCEPSCLAQRKGPLEVDIPQGPWPGACPEVEQPSQRDLKCGMLPLAQSEGEGGRAQNVEAEQPSPTLSLPTSEQQQQPHVSRRILSADS
ncbi:hypothetical protein DUNSADRAFT_9933 [Dunaliella salina]|uniref:Uncharacterized protein n=1 Tax=Dunaliella salina TaxID=3046 RepID=A0ABQ7GGG5_DUNSA|nr:hypothetical protein DUNSADRAFT_9933 [Dunaliella salina]|eukprot:KAF5833700.1 hypothetical protein DUNSADRAFT_9933 [Dunaliella salina]